MRTIITLCTMCIVAAINYDQGKEMKWPMILSMAVIFDLFVTYKQHYKTKK